MKNDSLTLEPPPQIDMRRNVGVGATLEFRLLVQAPGAPMADIFTIWKIEIYLPQGSLKIHTDKYVGIYRDGALVDTYPDKSSYRVEYRAPGGEWLNVPHGVLQIAGSGANVRYQL